MGKIQLRRATAAQWFAANPVLANGEQGFETDTKKIKVGDGSTAWNSLTYISTWGGSGGGGGGSAWGDISGTLSAQLDLQAALDAKQPLATVLTNTTASFTTALQTKLSGIATGATANSSDATLLARANHTGTQAISTITGLQTALDAKLDTSAAFSGSYTDLTDKPAIPTNTSDLTNDSGFITSVPVSSVAGKTGTVTLVKGDVGLGNVDNTSDANKPISTATQTALDGKQPLATVLTNTTASFTTAQQTKLSGIATGATANSSDATLLSRSNHTGTQAISTVTGLQTALDGKVKSDVTGVTGADAVTNVISLTQSEYDAITPNSSTLYIIVGA